MHFMCCVRSCGAFYHSPSSPRSKSSKSFTAASRSLSPVPGGVAHESAASDPAAGTAALSDGPGGGLLKVLAGFGGFW
jgi:hypothetical protein